MSLPWGAGGIPSDGAEHFDIPSDTPGSPWSQVTERMSLRDERHNHVNSVPKQGAAQAAA